MIIFAFTILFFYKIKDYRLLEQFGRAVSNLEDSHVRKQKGGVCLNDTMIRKFMLRLLKAGIT
jgi:hypothetical protein